MSGKLEDVHKLIPAIYKETGFKENTLDYQIAQSDEYELWLFQFPPQVTTEDFAKCNITIPPRSKITAAGKHVYIASFTLHNANYALFEVPSSEAGNMVNLWSDEKHMENGELYRGKPFYRYFTVLVDVGRGITGQHRIIDSMPLGFNVPFVPQKILFPVGITNPYEHDNTNIIKAHKKDDFYFSAGNYPITVQADKEFMDPKLKKKGAVERAAKSTLEKDAYIIKNGVVVNNPLGVKTSSTKPTVEKKTKTQPAKDSVAIASEEQPNKSKKSKKNKVDEPVAVPHVDVETPSKPAKKAKKSSDNDSNELVTLATQDDKMFDEEPAEKKSKKEKKEKKSKK